MNEKAVGVLVDDAFRTALARTVTHLPPHIMCRWWMANVEVTELLRSYRRGSPGKDVPLPGLSLANFIQSCRALCRERLLCCPDQAALKVEYRQHISHAIFHRFGEDREVIGIGGEDFSDDVAILELKRCLVLARDGLHTRIL